MLWQRRSEPRGGTARRPLSITSSIGLGGCGRRHNERGLEEREISCYYTIMNRATFIEKLTEVQKTVEQLLAQLQASEPDKFAAHLYQPAENTGPRASDATSSADRPLGPRN